jgi:hypothetical protein
MNGAIAEPLEITISTANISRITIRGISQYFFLVFKKSQRSLRNSIRLKLKWFFKIGWNIQVVPADHY